MKVMPSYALTAENTYGAVPGAVQSTAGGIQTVLALLERLKVI
jgi:hypothetical protein